MTNASRTMDYRHERGAEAIRESPRWPTRIIQWLKDAFTRPSAPRFWEGVLRSFGETRVRVLVAAALILTATPLVLLGGLWFQGMLLLVTGLAAREWCRLKKFEHTPSYLAVILVSAGALVFLPKSVALMAAWGKPLWIVSLILLVGWVVIMLIGKTTERSSIAGTPKAFSASRDSGPAIVQFLRMATLSSSIVIIVFYLASLSLIPWVAKFGFLSAGFALAGIGVAWWVFVLLRRLWTFSEPESSNPTDPKWVSALEGWLVLVPAGAALAWMYTDSKIGPDLVMIFMIIVWAADSAAWFFGKIVLGRLGYSGHLLAGEISPRKTWEGLAGGFAFGTFAGVVSAWWFGLHLGWFPGCGRARGGCIGRGRSLRERLQTSGQNEGQWFLAAWSRGGSRSDRWACCRRPLLCNIRRSSPMSD